MWNYNTDSDEEQSQEDVDRVSQNWGQQSGGGGPSDQLWMVEDIVKTGLNRGVTEYLISWQGVDSTGRPWERSWEPLDNLNEEAQDLVRRKFVKTQSRDVGMSFGAGPSVQIHEDIRGWSHPDEEHQEEAQSLNQTQQQEQWAEDNRNALEEDAGLMIETDTVVRLQDR